MNAGGMVLVFIVVAGFVCLVLWTMAKDREQARAREQRAMERGWQYIRGGGTGQLYTVEGAEGGVPWTLVSFHGGKNKQALSTWRTSACPLPGGVVFVGSKAFAAMLKNPLGNQLARWGLRVGGAGPAVTEAFNRLMEGHEEVTTGDGEFDARYAVLASDTGEARRLLSADVCRAMLEWENAHKVARLRTGELGVTWGDGGLSVSSTGATYVKPEDMAGFVDLCLSIRKVAATRW